MSTPTSCSAAAPVRPGMVLLLALLCLLALEVTAVGVHYVVLQELRTARAVGRTAQLRMAAQAAVGRAIAAWPAPGLAAPDAVGPLPVPAAAGQAPGGIAFSASIERLGEDLLIIRGIAESPLRERAGIGALVALASPELLATGARAAITASGSLELLPGSLVRGTTPSASPSPADPADPADSSGNSAASCTLAGHDHVPAVLVQDASSVTVSGGIVEGEVVIPPAGEAVAAGGFATLNHGAIARFARAIPLAVVTPIPVAGGSGCSDDSDSWGEPGDEVPACTDYLPILQRTGDLTISGGRGQGILAVDGNLTITGARFDGIVIVRGSVDLREGASIAGILVADGAVRIEQSAVIFDRCAIIDALRDIRVRGPFRTAARTWIPLF